MAEKINFADLEDFSGVNNVIPGAGIYALLFRKTANGIKTAYKFNVDSLQSFFLAEEELEVIKNKINRFRKSLEDLTKTFVTEEYFENNEYMLKYDADTYRNDLATEETIKAKIGDYLTKTGLKAEEKEAERHTLECAASYTTSMAAAAAAARAANARNNTNVSKFDELTEAVESTKDED